MPKRRLQIMLSEAALAELERRAGGPDRRQAYIERWLTGDIEESRNSLSPEAKSERQARKSERITRKAELTEAVSQALPQRPVTEPVSVPVILVSVDRLAGQSRIESGIRPHSFHSARAPIPGCPSCAEEVKAAK